ncbi:MAG: plasmid pRiA4b ORF-3 family protein [Bacteroidales bacterium]|nr:MAG: plasmid pRiA4b ORF-3 family protein [Bacteroidales bacterium]
MAKIFEIKATLQGLKSEVSRTFQVDSSINLQVLHEVFQALFAWENFHLHFYQDSKKQDIKKEDQVNLSKVLTVSNDLTYVYDYGDSWTIRCKLIRSFDDSSIHKYPLCIEGLRKAPPEDSGGVTGYEMSLELMAGKSKKDFSLISEWYGDNYNPDYFSLDEVNKALSQLRG